MRPSTLRRMLFPESIVAVLAGAVQGRGLWLVTEVTDAGKDHGQIKAVCGVNHLLVANRASRLDHSGGAGPGDFLHAIRKWEESVRSRHCAFHGKHGLHGPDLAGIHTRHLSRAYAHALSIA